MNVKTHTGYLVLGDISGYTSYVAQTELEHSQAVLTELLELIVGLFRPLLTLAKLEGDAVFAHAPKPQVPRGESLLELIEATYVAFRGRVDGIVRHTTCECNACRAIPTLDLKFLVHCGDYIVQQVSGINELVGSDVNLLHRLTKNHVYEATGWRAYALFTATCLEHMAVSPNAMHEQMEAYEHLGEIKTYCLDLHARHKELTAERRVFVSPQDADATLTHEFAAPPPVVWEWLTDPRKRTQYASGQRWSTVTGAGGRTGVGSQNHCAHGKDALSVETILDWRPFDYFTVKSDADARQASAQDTISTRHLEPVADGRRTRLRWSVKLVRPSWIGRLALRMFGQFIKRALQRAEALMLEEMARQEAIVDQLAPEGAAAGGVVAGGEGG